MKNTAIKENHLFKKAYSKGERAAGKYIAIYALRDKAAYRIRRADPCHRSVNRLGLTVGKHVGGAVERNRAKRLMREAYRLTEAELCVKHGYLLVIVAKDAVLSASSTDVGREMRRLLDRLGLLSPCEAQSSPDR